ncbi:MAG: hypothetical protein ACOC7O_02460, partial [Thermoplasmatota archaeon]
NNCAHFGKYTPTNHSVLDFFGDIINGIAFMRKKDFEKSEKEFINYIIEIDDKEEIKNLPTKGNKVIRAVKIIFEKLNLTDEPTDVERYKNLYAYLENLIKSSTDEKVLDEIIDGLPGLLESHKSLKIKKSTSLGNYITKTARFKEKGKNRAKLIDRLIEYFSESWSYREAERRLELILNVKNLLTEEQIDSLAKATVKNDQIHKAHGCQEKLPLLFESEKEVLSEEIKEELNKKEIL